MDWEYINAELSKLGIYDYEKKSRNLATKLFQGVRLNDEEKELLDYYIFSDTYGNFENQITNTIYKKANSKTAYILDRLIVPMDVVKESFPTFYKDPILLPLLPAYRFMRNFKINKARYLLELKNANKTIIKRAALLQNCSQLPSRPKKNHTKITR